MSTFHTPLTFRRSTLRQQAECPSPGGALVAACDP